jgi:hypothetical protein
MIELNFYWRILNLIIGFLVKINCQLGFLKHFVYAHCFDFVELCLVLRDSIDGSASLRVEILLNCFRHSFIVVMLRFKQFSQLTHFFFKNWLCLHNLSRGINIFIFLLLFVLALLFCLLLYRLLSIIIEILNWFIRLHHVLVFLVLGLFF